MLWLRRALAVGLLLLSAVFAASVVCPRREERRLPPAPRTLEGLADPRPAALEPAPAPPRIEERTAEPPAAAPAELIFAVVEADGGAVVAHAELEVRWAAPDGERVWKFPADDQGRRHVHGVEAGECTVQARASGYLPAAPLAVAVQGGRQEVQVPLQAGALVSGRLWAGDGGAVNFGLLRLYRADGAEASAKPGSRGAFAFEAIPAGTWTLEWREQPHAEPDPRALRTMDLQAHQGYEFDVVVDLPRRPGDQRRPGIQLRRVTPF